MTAPVRQPSSLLRSLAHSAPPLTHALTPLPHSAPSLRSLAQLPLASVPRSLPRSTAEMAAAMADKQLMQSADFAKIKDALDVPDAPAAREEGDEDGEAAGQTPCIVTLPARC